MIETKERPEVQPEVHERVVHNHLAEYRASQQAEARRRKRKRKIMLVFMVLITAGVLCYYFTKNIDDTGVEIALESTNSEFSTFEQVKSQLTSDMHTRNVDQAERDALSEFGASHREMSDKINFLSDNLSAYPSYAVSALIGSPEKIDYILAYPIMKGTPAADNIIINVEKGELPYLLQWDSRWGYATYGDSIGFCGCGPTCISMVAMGLTGNTKLTPDVISNYAYNCGYYVENAGTDWSLMTESAADFGLTVYGAEVEESAMYSALDKGGKFICSVSAGDFTSTGHFIVISGYTEKGFTVLDPNSAERSGRYWSYSVLAPQIAGMWVYYPA